MTEFKTIIYEVDRGRARITLNRPEKLNALSNRFWGDLRSALSSLEADGSTRVAIIRSRPGRGR